MTRKDFELIAGVINGMIEDGTLNYSDAIAVACRFEEALVDTNVRFDRKRFYQASTEALKRKYRLYSMDALEEEDN